MKDTFDEIIGKVLMHSHDAGDVIGSTPSAGTVTYTGNKITRIVKGSTTYDYTYIGNKLNTITDGTTVWTILYLGNKISGWTI